MKTYTISREQNLGYLVYDFFQSESAHVAALFDNRYDWKNFNFDRYAKNHYLWVCWREGKPIGLMMAQLYGSVFDPSTKVLYQDLLYCKKSSGRAAFLLMQEFIAFGRANVKMVFTCRAKCTNVKEITLNRLGFQKAEELYCLVPGE